MASCVRKHIHLYVLSVSDLLGGQTATAVGRDELIVLITFSDLFQNANGLGFRRVYLYRVRVQSASTCLCYKEAHNASHPVLLSPSDQYEPLWLLLFGSLNMLTDVVLWLRTREMVDLTMSKSLGYSSLSSVSLLNP